MLPSDPHPSEGGHWRGWRGESRLLRELEGAKAAGQISDFLQPDAVVLPIVGTPFLCETKDQEVFESPPFDGHGLPVWQARRYEQVRLATRIRTLLVIYDLPSRYAQWLDKLERGEKYVTAGTVKWPRVVYPLASFQRRSVGL